jgi:hypothetical protein
MDVDSYGMKRGDLSGVGEKTNNLSALVEAGPPDNRAQPVVLNGSAAFALDNVGLPGISGAFGKICASHSKATTGLSI